jgi:hypothetical protein
MTLRGEWQSSRFKAVESKPSLSILDYALVPLDKPKLPIAEAGGQQDGQSFDLFMNKGSSGKTGRDWERWVGPDGEACSQKLIDPRRGHSINLWRHSEPDIMDYVVWPLELTSETRRDHQG